MAEETIAFNPFFQALLLRDARHAKLTKQFYEQLQTVKSFKLADIPQVQEIPRIPRITSENLPVRVSQCKQFNCVRFMPTGSYALFSPMAWSTKWPCGNNHQVKLEDIPTKVYIDIRLAALITRWECFQATEDYYKTTNYEESEHTRIVFLSDEQSKKEISEEPKDRYHINQYFKGELFAIQTYPKELVVCEHERPTTAEKCWEEGIINSKVVLARRLAQNLESYYDKQHRRNIPAKISTILEKELYDFIPGLNLKAKVQECRVKSGSEFGKRGSFVVYNGELYTDIGCAEFDSWTNPSHPPNFNHNQIKIMGDKRIPKSINEKDKARKDYEKNRQLYEKQFEKSVDASACLDRWPQLPISQTSSKIRQLPINGKFIDVRTLRDAAWVCIPAETSYGEHTLLAIGGTFHQDFKYDSRVFKLEHDESCVDRVNNGIMIFGFQSVDVYGQGQIPQEVYLKTVINDDRLGCNNPAATVMCYFRTSDGSTARDKNSFELFRGNVYIIAGDKEHPDKNAIYEYNPRLPASNNSAEVKKEADCIRKVGRCKKRDVSSCTNFNGKVYIFGGTLDTSKRVVEIFDPSAGNAVQDLVTSIEQFTMQPFLTRPVLSVLHPLLTSGDKTETENKLLIFGSELNLKDNNYVAALKLRDGSSHTDSWDLFDGMNISTKSSEEIGRQLSNLTITDFEGVHRQNSLEFMCLHTTYSITNQVNICKLVFTTDNPKRSNEYSWHLARCE